MENKTYSRSVNAVPRASGDEPYEWGDLVGTHHLFPAPAGMNRIDEWLNAQYPTVPRASGDEPEKIHYEI